MKKVLTAIFSISLGLFALAGSVNAEQARPELAAIKQACTEEAQGAIDVNEYIESCVKEKMEELNEAGKEGAGDSGKS